MKTRNLFLVLIIISSSLSFTSCQEEGIAPQKNAEHMATDDKTKIDTADDVD